jgi:hypothetical protein
VGCSPFTRAFTTVSSAITAAIENGGEIERLIQMKTLYLGPDELLVAAKLAFSAGLPLDVVSAPIDAIDQRIRTAVPAARVISIRMSTVTHPQTLLRQKRSCSRARTDARSALWSRMARTSPGSVVGMRHDAAVEYYRGCRR